MISASASLRLGIAVLFAVAVALAWAAPAAAQVDAGREDIQTLEKNLAAESAALSTSDCTNACRALASIRRAADRICALDPDDRCAAARAKARDATNRVREACPDCALASVPVPVPKQEDRAMSKGGRHAPVAEGVPTAQAAPPAESRKGGCASCTTSGATTGDVGTAALAALALAYTLRRRKR